MDIRALRYFVELVREQSFTRASEKLFVTPVSYTHLTLPTTPYV